MGDGVWVLLLEDVLSVGLVAKKSTGALESGDDFNSKREVDED